MIPDVFDTPEPQIVSADGTRIWAAQAGRAAADAPAIVFVPGYALPSLMFEKQFQDAELLSRFCLITYEPRGQGRSTAVSDTGNPWAPDKMAEDFEAVCQYYGATKVFFAGWSYGCIIACDVFASGRGHYIAGLIYIAGMPCKSVFSTCYTSLTADYYSPRLGTPAMADGDTVGALYRGFVESCVLEPYRSSMSYTLKMAVMGSMTMTTASQRRREGTLRVQDPTKLLAAVAVGAAGGIETLFIQGSSDEVVKTQVIQEYLQDNFARLQTAVINEAGHAPFWERPGDVNKVLMDFMDRVSTNNS